MATEGEGTELGSAYIKLTLRREELTKQLREVETDIQQTGAKAENESGGGGLMSKYLFGRRGPGGVGDSVEHAMSHAAFGRMFRTFAAGGVMGVGVGMLTHAVFDLGREWFNMATGATAAADATERVAESNKKAADSMAELIKMTQASAEAEKKPISAVSAFERAIHPPGAVGAAKEALSGNQKKIDEQRAKEKKAEETANGTTLTVIGLNRETINRSQI